MGRWSSGYDAALTTRRSQVRILAGPLSNLKTLLKKFMPRSSSQVKDAGLSFTKGLSSLQSEDEKKAGGPGSNPGRGIDQKFISHAYEFYYYMQFRDEATRYFNKNEI